MGLMDNIVEVAEQMRGSDVHVAAGVPVRVRVDGKLVDMNDHVLTPEDCEAIARDAAGRSYEKIAEIGELDMADTYEGHVRCRLNIYRSMRSVCLAIRLLSNTIPKLSTPHGQALYTIRGIVPDLSTLPKGCVFSTRCDCCLDVCHERRPPLREMDDGRRVRCFRCEGGKIVD